MVTYSDTTDKHLLIAVIQELKVPNPTSAQWEAINTRLGLGSTAGGLSQRYSKKLMKTAIGDGVVPATGSKRKGTPVSKTPKSNKKSKVMGIDDDNDDSPAMTAHKKQMKKEVDVKAEPGDEESDIANSSPAKSEGYPAF